MYSYCTVLVSQVFSFVLSSIWRRKIYDLTSSISKNRSFQDVKQNGAYQELQHTQNEYSMQNDSYSFSLFSDCPRLHTLDAQLGTMEVKPVKYVISPLNICYQLKVHYFLLDLTDLTINGCNFQKFNHQRFQQLKKINKKIIPGPCPPPPTLTPPEI